jgi:hypothetical protein
VMGIACAALEKPVTLLRVRRHVMGTTVLHASYELTQFFQTAK